jgi:tetratricopeptide (TPR) repeat protein
MARDLKKDQELLGRVLYLAQNRDHRGAAALAEQALAEGFEHPLLFNVAATHLEEEGKLEEAVRLLERGVELAPADVPVRNALSLVLQRLSRPGDALVHVESILAQHPQLAFAHANKGNALIALGSLGLAQASHLRALELDPDNLAAMGSLASIATHRGDHAGARRWAQRVLARVPGYPDAVLSLAAADLAGGASARAESALRELLADRRAGDTDRARALGLLGDVLDVGERYAEAFEAYSACNQLTGQLHRRFAEPSLLAYSRALTQAFTAITPRWPVTAAPAPAEEGPAQHVLLMGFPRSGTTLLEVILDGHPQVVSLEEHDLFTEGVLRYLHDPRSFEALAQATESQLQELRTAYWRRVRAGGVEVAGKVFLDKHPLNTLKLPLIARLFPQAKILFARRDPRDVVLSCFRRRFKMNAAMYQMLTLESAARFYDAVMELAARAQPVLGLAWHEVRYERLIADFGAETRGICEFLGIEWTSGMSEFASRVHSRENATPSTAQLARGLDPSGVGHWRHYREHIAALEPVLSRWTSLYGIPP